MSRVTYRVPVAALELDTVRNVALVVVLGTAVLGLVIATVVRAVFGKLVTIAVLALIVSAVWSQRTNLQHCADRVRETAGGEPAATCSFFGHDVDVPV